MNKLASNGEIGDPLRGALLARNQGPVRHLHGGCQPPLNVEQDPRLVGVVRYRFQQQVLGNAVEEGPDVDIEYPVLSPTPPSRHRQCVMGTAPRTVAITVPMEDRLQLEL